MVLFRRVLLISLFLFTGVQTSPSLRNLQWLPCGLVEVVLQHDSTGQPETRTVHRDVALQFGNTGDTLVVPDAPTFLVTESRVDMRRFLEGEADQLQCEIRSYNTGGIQVRWKGPEAQEQDVWYTCTLRHSGGLFGIVTFLRHTPTTAQPEKEDYIGERETVITTAVLAVLTRTPSLEVGLLQEPTLHCQFSVDHKHADLTVEWRRQRHGERSKLFSYSSRSGKAEGVGASARAISNGDASLRLPLTSIFSEATYICSVYIPPLYGNHDITLHVVESPRVTLTVDSAMQLEAGEDRRVTCEAQGYYPLDVQIEWLREQPGNRLPEILKNVLFSSHRHLSDGTYSLSAFFLLQPQMCDSGYTYTCRVSHRSLRMPIRKSFTLTVTEPMAWSSVLLFMFIILILVLLACLLRYLHTVRQESKKKPY